jgi:hypothetical protein
VCLGALERLDLSSIRRSLRDRDVSSITCRDKGQSVPVMCPGGQHNHSASERFWSSVADEIGGASAPLPSVFGW